MNIPLSPTRNTTEIIEYFRERLRTSLEGFIGQPNTEETRREMEEITRRILDELELQTSH